MRVLFGILKDISSELVWLQLWQCPLWYLPDDFSHENLLSLTFQRVTMTFTCQTTPRSRIPHFSLYANLARLILTSCLKLVEIPNSVDLLRNLVYLDIFGCSILNKLLHSRSSLVNLKEL
ncbi:hypothetical protein AMTRI_Chr05g59600 [Amborella trichopoda]